MSSAMVFRKECVKPGASLVVRSRRVNRLRAQRVRDGEVGDEVGDQGVWERRDVDSLREGLFDCGQILRLTRGLKNLGGQLNDHDR